MQEKQKMMINKQISPKSTPDKVIGLDLSCRGLKSLSRSLFLLSNLKELILNNNEIEIILKDICQMTSLERLDLSHNKIRSIPPKLGKMVSLREVLLNDNLISTIPIELGYLYNIETFNLSNNPLIAPFNSVGKDKSIIQFCRENNTNYSPPADRAWIETMLCENITEDIISVGTFNILCNFFAAKLTYAPSWIINQDSRKDAIVQSIVSYNVDILCLQEVETYSYCDFYKEELNAKLGYDSVFFPKGRSQTLTDKRSVDGCATFWKKNKFKLVEQINIDFYNKIINDIRFSLNQDILMRNSRKDNVTVVSILERSNGELYIVVNVHLYWDPEYSDVKLFQTILLLEELEKIRDKYNNAAMLLMGDFNSLKGSSVYELIVERNFKNEDFNLYNYTPFEKEFSHSLSFNDAYLGQDLTFTNYTPTFKETIDYIFHDNRLRLVSVLSPVEEDYTDVSYGLPDIYFPSDHIFIGAKFYIKK